MIRLFLFFFGLFIIVNMVRASSSDESMICCDVLCCDVVLWPMERGVLACGTARADKSCTACRVPSMEDPPYGRTSITISANTAENTIQ
ncbi:hypothetical protein PoB_002617600 [Plakobranchus ocellatus]|uniref:Secreted protein n=1 Tax=Plakobranchus ocellatus TaxID=259542 RepID=A0AAV3ZYS0_9GAST|nr:hypothetical protein PoB_002617600 [Plakobranchus ocellatus]